MKIFSANTSTHLFLALLAILSQELLAEPYVPESPNLEVLVWSNGAKEIENTKKLNVKTQELSLDDSLVLANELLSQAGKIGESGRYADAKQLLSPWINQGEKNPALLIAWARILQHAHDFDAAISVLETVIIENPADVNANLLLARLYLIQNNFPEAKRACLRLLGSSSLFISSVCVFEVTSYTAPKEQRLTIYDQLVDMQAKRDGLENTDFWLGQILADLSLRLGLPEQAMKWMEAYPDFSSTTYLLEWADLKLSLGDEKEVYDRLVLIVEGGVIDDSILLYLAMAEKRLATHTEKKYEEKLRSRINLRLKRNDTHHAKDLALYFMHIDINPERALAWAKVNFQESKEFKDKELLRAAKTMEGADDA